MVIVTMAFLSVLATSVLVAVGFSYRLKLYNMNSKNNFYYVEQALDEIYAGVGNVAVQNLRKAYQDTVEVMVYYDTGRKAYVTRNDSDANKIMKKTFIQYMKNDNSFSINVDPGTGKSPIQALMEDAVTNPDIQLDLSNIVVDTSASDAVTIKNVTVKRTAKYKSGSNNSDYIQSITTDICVGEPAYNVNFSNTNSDHSELYDFSLVADAGIEITGATSSVNISGNIYGASDFYNKNYEAKNDTGATILSNTYSGAASDVSSYLTSEARYQECDGVREKSMYSGLYISGAKVILQAAKCIVPGSFSVFNGAQIVVSAKQEGKVVPSDMWVDNIVLGGYTPSTGSAKADMYANAHVYDDLELDATGSTFKMEGAYYGYNYSQATDKRSFNSVSASSYKTASGDNKEDHYNSSSIILNGDDSNLDFSTLDKMYIAGRAYVEMSKKVSKDTKTINNGESDEDVETKTYEYDNTINDYVTGESVSVKSNQLAYMPIKNWIKKDTDGKYYAEIPNTAKEPYKNFFADLKKVPVIKQTVSGVDFYFFDFGSDKDDQGKTIFKTAEDKQKFIEGYAALFAKDDKGNYSEQSANYLKDITNYDRFEIESLNLPTSDAQTERYIYSTGALTAKVNTAFSITAPQSALEVFDDLMHNFSGEEAFSYQTASAELNDEYGMIKYMLTVSSVEDDKNEYQQIKNADKSTTPFEKYFNVPSITNICQTGKTLPSGYQVWVSNGDVVVDSASESVQGIVVAKGDVTFASNVKTFQGLVVSGSKIKIDHSMNFFADAEIAKETLRQCKNLTGDSKAQAIWKCFKDYDKVKTGTSDSGDSTEATTEDNGIGDVLDDDDITPISKNVDEVQYTDVIAFKNWKRNVE